MAKRCSLCKRRISGKYVQYSVGDIYCNHCFNNQPRCSLCDKPTKNFKKIKNQVFCFDCLESIKKCDICNMPLVGKYIEYSNNFCVCQNCYETYPKCCLCDITIKDKHFTVTDKIFCPDCFATLITCSNCGKFILPGEVYTFFEAYSDAFCHQCMENELKCDACDRPVNNLNSWSLGDERILCGECNSIAVVDLKRANVIFKEMWNFLKSEFGIFIDHPIELKLVTYDKLKQLDTEKSLEVKRRGLFELKSENKYYTINMLNGLTENTFRVVAAHEFTHGWQSENCPPDQDDLLSEGFAMWIQYQVCKKIGDLILMKRIESDEESVYGKGFQKMREIEIDRGYYGLIQYVKTHKS